MIATYSGSLLPSRRGRVVLAFACGGEGLGMRGFAVKDSVAKLAESFGMIRSASKVSATFATVNNHRSLIGRNP